MYQNSFSQKWQNFDIHIKEKHEAFTGDKEDIDKFTVWAKVMETKIPGKYCSRKQKNLQSYWGLIEPNNPFLLVGSIKNTCVSIFKWMMAKRPSLP